MAQENVEIVRRLLSAFNTRDSETVLALWGADAAWHPALLGGGIMEGSVYRGHEGIIEFLGVQADTWATVTANPVTTRDVGDCVLVEVFLEAVGRTSGVPVQRTTWNVFEVRDGKVTDGHVYVTEQKALAAAGLTE